MRISALELILEADRFRRQAAERIKTGWRTPLFCQLEYDASEAPFLANNLRGTFLSTRRSKEGLLRVFFLECPIEDEDPLLVELHRVLWGISVQHNWSNRCTTIAQAVAKMTAAEMRPRNLVVSTSFLEGACGEPLSFEDAERLMMAQGFVVEVDGVKVLASTLPEGKGMLCAEPAAVGNYLRSGDNLGLLIRRANRSVVLIDDDLA